MASPATFTISGPIAGEDGITSRNVAMFVAGNRDKPLHFDIDSADGLSLAAHWDCSSIYSMICRHHHRTSCYITGDVSGAALTIVSGCDHRRMSRRGKLIVSPSQAFMAGNRRVAAERRNVLAMHDAIFANVLAARTGLSTRRVQELLDANDGDGTTLSAERALALGFVDALGAATNASNATLNRWQRAAWARRRARELTVGAS